MRRAFRLIVAALMAVAGWANSAIAGPIIIDGTDANDHGFASGGKNQSGWLYMQKVFENLGPQVGNGNKTVVALGVNGFYAAAALNSAFGLSTLPGAGWNMVFINGSSNIDAFLKGGTVNGVNLGNTGILHLPTVGHASGDMTSAELNAVNNNAEALAAFVAAGGGFWSMSETGPGAFGWLSTLIPGIGFVDGGDFSPITLTPDGVAAFPGLTNADTANAIPWHAYFTPPFGGLNVLGVAKTNGVEQPVILGGGATTTFAGAPEPSSVALCAILGVAGVGYVRVRRQTVASSNE